VRLKSLKLVFAAVFVCIFSNAAGALTIDFSGFASGDTGLSTLSVGDATFDVLGGTVFVYRPGDFGGFTDSGGVCALSGGNCETDWTLTFDFAVTNLTFESEFYNDVDSVLVEAFNGMTSLGTVGVLANGSFGFGSAVITSLSFDDSSSGAGFGFGDFTFDRSNPIPEPTSAILFGVGSLVVASAMRRRQD
jgi:hypothetical protein